MPGGEGKRGRPAQDNRRFIDAVCWILRTGAPWRDLPPGLADYVRLDQKFAVCSQALDTTGLAPPYLGYRARPKPDDDFGTMTGR